MMKKIWPFKKKDATIPAVDNGLYQDLFKFLSRKISIRRSADELLQLSYKAHDKGTDELFRVYLLFEKYICTFEKEQDNTPKKLRKEIEGHFPEIVQKNPFSILFLSDTEKKNNISLQFLSSLLSNVIEQFGHAGDSYCQRKQIELIQFEERIDKEEIFRELQFLSFDVFQFVNNNYGESVAGKLFEKTYERFSAKYKELKAFPHLLTLIPKEILRREHLGLFTQAQIEQVFLEKLAETEELNIELHRRIKDQEATQKLLAKNEVMLSSVIASALDAIVIFNNEGQIMRWNTAAEELFGYCAEEVTGRAIIDVILPKEYLEKREFQLQRFLGNPNNRLLKKRHEITCVTKDGATFPAELTITSFQNDRDYFFNGFIRDISMPKQREEELVKTKERAEEAAKAKSQFLSIMSHEIRTPLNAIIGFSELLSQNSPREDQKEDLKMLRFSGENLLSIINDILDFSKLESGKVQISHVPFNLRDLAQSMYQSFSYKAKEKQIVFDVEYDEQMPFMVKGDSLRLSQILNNLISNAIKFTSSGSVKLKITLEESSLPGLRTTFSVFDTGIGIETDQQNKIFEQFIQANSETTRLFGGTGLGLSISNKLAELMGSKIIVDSTPGKGSAFYFTIIFQPSEAKEAQAHTNKGSQADLASFMNKKILLAEDNPFNANIARRYITGWGAEMDVALDGQQALEFALRKNYDLILMDVQMPVLDGFACSRAIRQHFYTVPIIAITAAPINEVIEQIRQSGMNDYVSKPFKPAELRQKMLTYLLKEK